MSAPVSAWGTKMIAAWLLACAPTAALTNLSTLPFTTIPAVLTSVTSVTSSLQSSEAAAIAAAAKAGAQAHKRKHSEEKAEAKLRKEDVAVARAKVKRAKKAVKKAAAADSKAQMQEKGAEAIANQYGSIAKNLNRWSKEEVQQAKVLKQRASAAVAEKEAATALRNTEATAVHAAQSAEAAAETSEREPHKAISRAKQEEKHAHGLDKKLVEKERAEQHAALEMDRLRAAEETEVAEERMKLEKSAEVNKKVAAKTAKSLTEDASRRKNGATYLAKKAAVATRAEEAARQEADILAKKQEKLSQHEATEKKLALRYAQPQPVMLFQGATPTSAAVCVLGVLALILASWFIVPPLCRHTHAPHLEQQLLAGSA